MALWHWASHFASWILNYLPTTWENWGVYQLALLCKKLLTRNLAAWNNNCFMQLLILWCVLVVVLFKTGSAELYRTFLCFWDQLVGLGWSSIASLMLLVVNRRLAGNCQLGAPPFSSTRHFTLQQACSGLYTCWSHSFKHRKKGQIPMSMSFGNLC